MANTTATVISLKGQAWAKAADGSLRPLHVGDSVAPQEVIVTAKDARLELGFGEGQPVVISGGQQVAISPDLWTDLAADNKDASVQEASVREALTILNKGGDLSDDLDATAAGLSGGGADEGHGFVQLTRVVESTTGQSFSFATNNAAEAVAVANFADAAANPTRITEGTGEVKEDETTSTGGKLQIIDLDPGEAAFVPQIDTAGNYGNFSIDADGNWTYVLNNDDPAVQGLAEGATLPREVFTVTSIDGTTQVVTVGITGTNDIASIIPEPTMSVPGPGAPLPRNDQGFVKEDVVESTGGRLLVSDADIGQDIFQVQNNVSSAHGSFSIDKDGFWTYQLNNDDPAVQALKEGETLPPEIFTVLSSDGSASHNVTVTIIGTNDIATITTTTTGSGSASDKGAVKEDVVLTTGGKLTVTDVDTGEAVFQVQNNIPGAHGTFSIDANGNWTYQLNNDDPAVQALKEGETLPSEIFTVKSSDGSASHPITVSITGTNDTAIITTTAGAGSDKGAVKEDVVLTTGGQLKVADVDAGEAAFQVQNNIVGAHGSFSIDKDGNWNYQLNNADPAVQALKEGETLAPETFTVLSKDGSASHNVVITITGTNDAPVAKADSGFGTLENTPKTFLPSQLLVNDLDLDGDSLTITSVQSATHGTVVLNNLGQVVFTPDNQYSGPASFTYTITDGHGGSSTATVSLAVSHSNKAPVAVNDQVTTEEDTQIIIAPSQLLNNDTDADGDALVITSVQDATHGSVALVNGNVVFIPEANYTGNLASFTYTVADIYGATATATVSVNVTPGNDAPVAVDDPGKAFVKSVGLHGEYYSYFEGPNGLNLTNIDQAETFIANHGANATFVATNLDYGDASMRTSLGMGNNLELFLRGDKASLSNAHPGSSDAIIRMSGAIELAAGTHNFRVYGDDGYQIKIDGVVVAQFNGNQAPTTNVHNEFTLATSGLHRVEILYWDQGVQAVLKVEISSDHGATYNVLSSQTTTHVSAYLMNEDETWTVSVADLLANDSDKNGDVLSIVSVQNAVNGTVQLNNNGTVSFTPTANFSGAASYTYTVSDGHGGTDTATVSIDVLSINDNPLANNDILIAAKNTAAEGSNQFAIAIPQSDLLVNDTDIDGNKLSIKSVEVLPNGASNGYAWITPSGEVMFLPKVGFTGDASFTYTISDNFGGTSTATATVKVATINGNDSANTLNGTSDAGETIAGLGGNDTIIALGGNDFIDGGAGNDSINGGAGNDLIKGGSGNDFLEGGLGDDKLIGGLDNDQLSGGAGNDVLEGSAGNDLLTGGAGADTFVWHLVDKGTKTLPATDTITDFTVGAGGDKLDIKDLLQNENSGNLTEYLHFTYNGADTTISISSAGDFNGNNFSTATDQTIVLSGVNLTTMGTDADIINQLKNNANLITD